MRDPLDILKEYWKYPSFRPLQREIIDAVLQGNDTLALLPTGGGKSICFQVPVMAQEGLCIVVSPLIALMKDQVMQLQARNIPATAIYSGMHRKEIDRHLDNCVYGKIKFLYLSPERLTTQLLRERISQMPVSLLAVDEAHCISQWGYDFRPPYLRIAEVRDIFPKVPVLALTATATPDVIDDIQDKLAFAKNKQVFQSSFERKNLSYLLRQAEGKMGKLEEILQKTKGSSIVYVRNRRKTKEIAYWLRKKGISADFYHAGLDMIERDARQEAWIRGNTRVIVSTNAFGMGIDKSNVRTVIHMDLPESLEAYFQEAGRAGRDEKPAFAILLYSKKDRRRLERNHALSFPEMEEVRRVYRALGSYYQLATGGGMGDSFDFEITAFCDTYQFDTLVCYHCLRVLEQSGWISLTDAVFMPASLEIKVNKDVLYDFQLRHPKMDKILKAILRSHQGAFSHPIHLKEGQLANFLNIPLSNIRKAMQLLQAEGIVEYYPARDQPQLTYIRDRVDADALDIDMPSYRFRREQAEQRLKAVLAYAENEVCRSQQLLRYFGQLDPPRCGSCDVCRKAKKKSLSNTDFTTIKAKIEDLLQEQPLSIEQIVSSFAGNWQERVLEAINFLVDEGYIVEEDNLLWKVGKR